MPREVSNLNKATQLEMSGARIQTEGSHRTIKHIPEFSAQKTDAQQMRVG